MLFQKRYPRCGCIITVLCNSDPEATDEEYADLIHLRTCPKGMGREQDELVVIGEEVLGQLKR